MEIIGKIFVLFVIVWVYLGLMAIDIMSDQEEKKFGEKPKIRFESYLYAIMIGPLAFLMALLERNED